MADRDTLSFSDTFQQAEYYKELYNDISETIINCLQALADEEFRDEENA